MKKKQQRDRGQAIKSYLKGESVTAIAQKLGYSRASRFCLAASVALRAPEATKQTKSKKPCVNDVMALFGVNDVMALKTYAPGFMLSPASQVVL